MGIRISIEAAHEFALARKLNLKPWAALSVVESGFAAIDDKPIRQLGEEKLEIDPDGDEEPPQALTRKRRADAGLLSRWLRDRHREP